MEDFIDLTEEYNKLFSQDDKSKNTDSYIEDMWKSINDIAGKKMLKTSDDELCIGIIDTKYKKSHVIFGDKPRNKSELKRETVYVLNIEKLINAAKYSDTDKTKNPTKKGKKEILAYHYFKTKVKINDSFYNIRFATEELTINEIERYKKIGKLPPAEVSSEMSSLRTTWKSPPNNHSIAHGKNLSSRIPKNSFLYQISDSRDTEYEIQYLKNRAPTATVDGQNVYVYEHDGYAARICHGVKENDKTAIKTMAENLAAKITEDCVIVPIPQHTGKAEYTLEVANLVKSIVEEKSSVKIEVQDALECEPHKMLYEQKKEMQKEGVLLTDEQKMQLDTGNLRLKDGIDKNSFSGKNILVLDNVVSTGTTLKEAQKILPGAKPLVFAMGKTYIEQSQNQSPIQMDIRPMQNKTEENKMQKQNYYTNLKGFVANSGSSFGRTEIAVDRENGTITVEQNGEQPIMPGAEMNWNGFSLVDFEHQDENTRYHKYTAELNERTAAFAEEIRMKALDNINPEDYEATTEYPESKALSKAGWVWTRYQDGSGGFSNPKNPSQYDIGYDATTNEGWSKDKNSNKTDFFYRTGYDDEGVEIFDLEKFKAAAEEKIANLLNINIEQENAMEKQNEQTPAQKAATNFVLEKLAQAGIEVITDKVEMREILNSGKLVQKMAAYHGTSHEGEIDNAFNGFGTYVVSVNTDVAKEQGMKIASKKYGDAFYIKSNGQEQTLDKFLSEHGYSSYWNELLKQTHFDDVAKLQHEIMATDSKGNAELEGQKTNLSVLLSAGVIEYKREKTYLYSIDIPDNNGKNYLFYEKSIGLDAANNINAALENMGVEWRVDRRDAGRQVYFNTLSEKVFNGNQEQTSKFLKDIGYAGMEMNSSNYIVFDEKDIVVNKRVQYMMDENGEVYGFTQDGKIYLDPDLMNSNTPVHEYTHIWDAYTQRTNPELWEKGKAVLQQTHLWQEVVSDPNYAEIADDEDLVLSEVHSRICGAMAEKVLERIAAQDGEIAKDRAIDWDKETWDYIESELLPTNEQRAEFTRNGGSVLDLKEFLATPMQDFMNGKKIMQEILQEQGQAIQKMVGEHNFPKPEMYFKFNQEDSKKFETQIDNFDGLNPLQLINVGKIPPVMKALGISDNPIEMPQSVVSKALREEAVYPDDKKGHALTLEHIKKIPESLADPIMIFKSLTREDSYVFFTEQKDKVGRSVIIPVAVDKKYGRLVINEITSIYGRNNEVDFVKNSLSGLVYADKKRSLDWERECKVQFLAQVLPKEGSVSNILTKENLVKFISSQNSQAIQKMVERPTVEIAEEKTQTNSFIDALRDSDKAIEEATNGIGHDPTDGLSPDFEPPLDNAEMEMKGGMGKEEFEIAEPEGQVELIIPDSVRVAIYESEATQVIKAEYGDSYIMKSQEIYANEICSALEKFSQENSADWNIEAHDKTSVYHLMAVAEIGSVSREESVEKIKEYFSTDIYSSEREQLGEMFAKIIETKTNDGYGFNFSIKQKEIEVPEKEQAVDEKAQKAAVMKEMLEKIGVKDGRVPEFAMITQGGLKSYKDMSIAEWNPKDQTFTLAKYEDGVAVEKAVVTARTLKELVSQPRIEQTQSFDESTPLYDKMLRTQYRDFFERRDNSSSNFRHNFAVICRQDLTTPTDAIRKASELIKAMPVEERRKTRELFNIIGDKRQSTNEKLVELYKEALKDVPPNEHYLAQKRAVETERFTVKMFDTVTANGQQVDKGFNLKIGDTINNVSFKVDKIFDTGKEKLLMDCKIVSATKEGNSVTLVDAAGGYHDVPRDMFLKQYAKQQKQEHKQDRHQKNIMRLDIER